MRTCSSCKETKAKDQFRPGNKSAKCKSCLAAQSAAYYANNKQKWVDRDKKMREQDSEAFRKRCREAQARYRVNPANTIHLRYLKARYGITVEQYAEMYDAQKGVCAICKQAPNKTRLHVDHNHKTGEVRGLLCFKCNAMLGSAQDSPTTLRAAFSYLLAHTKTIDLAPGSLEDPGFVSIFDGPASPEPDTYDPQAALDSLRHVDFDEVIVGPCAVCGESDRNCSVRRCMVCD